MLKKIRNIVIKLILSISLLYGFNIIMSPINIIIPINVITILIIFVLDFYGIIGLTTFLLLVY